MTAINNTEVTASLLAFFETVPSYAIVELTNNGSRSAWTGRYQTNAANDRVGVKLLSLSTGNVFEFPVVNTDAEFKLCKDDEGEIEMVPPYVREMARIQLASSVENRRLRENCDKARNDWDKLGGLLMQEANDRDWCSDYDRLVEKWNQQFDFFELPTRKKDYEVEVTVTATYTVTVRVEDQEDEDAAREEVENWSAHDILSQAGQSWNYPDDSEFEVNDVSEA